MVHTTIHYISSEHDFDISRIMHDKNESPTTAS
jgi:hypothetical protein